MSKSTSIFYSVIGLFFFWGFVAASNDVLIPVFKDHLKMEQWQTQMISFVFYVAYTMGSMIYLFISHSIKEDLLQKIGYARGLSIGLFISFIGTLFFIPATQHASFLYLITGLFVIGLGFSLQQTAANPLIITSGDDAYGSQRLSLAGGINNIGTTIGPLIVSYAVFKNTQQPESIYDLKYPYLILGGMFLIIATLFFKHKNDTASNASDVQYFQQIKKIIKKKQVQMGMMAIFLYVGVEVSTAANLAEFAKTKATISTSEIAPYIALYWAFLMIGRWASASDIFADTKRKKLLLKIIFPLIAFFFFLLILKINNKHIPHVEWVLGYIMVMLLLDFLSKGNAAKQLALYALAGILFLILGMITKGLISVYNIIAVGLFCSTLWPCIFEIALKGMNKYTGIVSSLLIMMIMGGGWVSVLQGYLAKPLGISGSYIVGVFCFAYLSIYGWIELKNNDINIEKTSHPH